MKTAQWPLYSVQALCLIIIKAATLQQTMQISLNLHEATICYTANCLPPEKVKKKRFYCISIFYTVLMGIICKTHVRGIATAYPTWALQVIYIRFSCYSSYRHVKCLLLLYCHRFHSTYTCCWASGLLLKEWENIDVFSGTLSSSWHSLAFCPSYSQVLDRVTLVSAEQKEVIAKMAFALN